MTPKLIIISAILVFLYISCEDTNPIQPNYGYFQYFQFERRGGGQKIFSVHPTTSPDSFEFRVSKFDFSDTSFLFYVLLDSTNSSIFNNLEKALNNQSQFNGNFKQPSLPTGTWSYFYLIKDSIKTEITNPLLREQLSDFENMVEERIQN